MVPQLQGSTPGKWDEYHNPKPQPSSILALSVGRGGKKCPCTLFPIRNVGREGAETVSAYSPLLTQPVPFFFFFCTAQSHWDALTFSPTGPSSPFSPLSPSKPGRPCSPCRTRQQFSCASLLEGCSPQPVALDQSAGLQWLSQAVSYVDVTNAGEGIA